MSLTEQALERQRERGHPFLHMDMSAFPQTMPFGTYDRDGTEISWVTYLVLASDEEYLRIGRDEICDGVHVSTVWLGMAAPSPDDTGPYIFETMVFAQRGRTERYRWRTAAEAADGHVAVVDEMRRQLL